MSIAYDKTTYLPGLFFEVISPTL